MCISCIHMEKQNVLWEHGTDYSSKNRTSRAFEKTCWSLPVLAHTLLFCSLHLNDLLYARCPKDSKWQVEPGKPVLQDFDICVENNLSQVGQRMQWKWKHLQISVLNYLDKTRRCDHRSLKFCYGSCSCSSVSMHLKSRSFCKTCSCLPDWHTQLLFGSKIQTALELSHSPVLVCWSQMGR